MENIVDLIIRILTLLIVGIEIIAMVWVWVRAKIKQAQNEQTETNRNIELQSKNKILELIPQFITQAEKIFGVVKGTGATKLLYVMQSLKNYCEAQNMDFDEEEVEEYIENILETPTKKDLTRHEEYDKDNNEGEEHDEFRNLTQNI